MGVLHRRVVHRLGPVLRQGVAIEVVGPVLTAFADGVIVIVIAIAMACEKTVVERRLRLGLLACSVKNAGRPAIGYGVANGMTRLVLVDVLADLPR